MVSIERALAYARAGYRILPCQGKRPATQHGVRDASDNETIIRTWWANGDPTHLGLSAEGLVIIDVDCRPGKTPPQDIISLLNTTRAPTVETPSGGRHYYFRRPQGFSYWRSGVLAESIDVRTNGAYVIVPPSPGYTWLIPLEQGIPDPPLWLINLLNDRSVRPSAPVARPIITEGSRNSTLTSEAGRLRRWGWSEDEIFHALLALNNSRCVPPLPANEIRQIAQSIGRYEPDATVCRPRRSLPQLPTEVFHVPGFIGQVVEHALSTAPYPCPPLALAGAVVLQGVLAARRVQDEMQNFTNIYVLALANSGSGKEHIRKINKEILSAVNALPMVFESAASGEAIDDQLQRQPSSIWQLDEMDFHIRSTNRSNAPTHIANIVEKLTRLYSSAGSTYHGRIRAGQRGSVIANPCLCVLGTAVPSAFYSALSDHLLENGFLARFIIIPYVGARRDSQVPERKPLPQAIIETAHYWMNFSPGGNLSAIRPQPRVVESTRDAQAVLADFQQAQNELYNSTTSAAAMSVYARAAEQARRLSLIYACSENPREPLITSNAARWACTLASYSAQYTLALAERYVVTSPFDSHCKKMLNILEQAGGWVARSELLRQMRIRSGELDDVYRALHEQGLVEQSSAQTGGRPSLCYRVIGD